MLTTQKCTEIVKKGGICKSLVNLPKKLTLNRYLRNFLSKSIPLLYILRNGVELSYKKINSIKID